MGVKAKEMLRVCHGEYSLSNFRILGIPTDSFQ